MNVLTLLPCVKKDEDVVCRDTKHDKDDQVVDRGEEGDAQDFFVNDLSEGEGKDDEQDTVSCQN